MSWLSDEDIFTAILDSLYTSDMKFKVIYLNKGMPSRTIFDRILNEESLPWFSPDKVKEVYEEVYRDMPNGDSRYDYQMRHWYRIYMKYRDEKIPSLDLNAKEYRMFRDMNIATINLFIVYILYCILSQKIYWTFIVFLLIAMIVTNVSARNKGSRWVINVILSILGSPEPPVQCLRATLPEKIEPPVQCLRATL